MPKVDPDEVWFPYCRHHGCNDLREEGEQYCEEHMEEYK